MQDGDNRGEKNAAFGRHVSTLHAVNILLVSRIINNYHTE